MGFNWRLENTKTKEVLEINKELFKIGRDKTADIQTTSPILSRDHASISQTEDGLLYVKDNKSQNGTYVNNRKITPQQDVLLKHGDHIIFGIYTLMKKTRNFTGPFMTYRVIRESVPNIDNTVYTLNDLDYIVISDDEDVDDLSRSQIFHISEKIKSEPRECEEFLDPYIDIKEEVRELDYCSQQDQQVDLTEQDHFESTSDLLNILESEITTTQKVTPGENLSESRIFEECQKELRVVLVNAHEQNCDVTEKSDSPKTLKPLKDSKAVKDEENSIKKESEKKERKLHVVLEKNPAAKNTKPLLIEPHHESSPRNIRKSLKRKSVDNIDEEPNKKVNNNTSVDTLETSLRETRKQKLREIALKSAEKAPSPKVTIETAKGKLADNRGAFLLNPDTSQPDKSLSSAATKSTKDPRLKKLESKPVNATDTNKSYERPQNHRLLRSSENKQMAPVVQNCVKDKGRVGLIYQLCNSNAPAVIPNNVKRHDLKDDICVILLWNVSWLMEARKNKGYKSPPVTDNKPITRIPSKFVNMQHYLDVMKPCIFLETWNYICESTFKQEQGRGPVKVRLEHSRRTDDRTTTFDCVSQDPNFRNEDLCVVNFFTQIDGATVSKDNFGYITNIRKRENNVYFSIMVKASRGIIKGNTIHVYVLANLSNFLHQFRTLKQLQHCPLSPYIMEPEKLTSLMPLGSSIIREESALNSIQQQTSAEAAELALGNKPGFYLIHGPPGTGKSSVIVSIVFQILFKARERNEFPSLLITAPSNAAIDSLIVKLADARSKLNDNDRKLIKLIRVGPEGSINEGVKNYSLREFTRKNVLSDYRLTQKYAHVAHQIDVNTFLKQELGELYNYALENTEMKLLQNANLICTTLSSSISYHLTSRRLATKYSACIIDEATQCTEIQCLFPIMLNVDKFILVGDPLQLPAVVCNKEAHEVGFSKSLFSRIHENFVNNRNDSPMKMLREQYRMNLAICDYPNKRFYEGLLKSSPICINPIQPQLKPYLVFNLKNPTNDNDSEYVNPNEVDVISCILKALLAHVLPSCKYSIGIITPYQAQKSLIIQSIKETRMNENVIVSVNTVDSFQGTEMDVIIISCVRYSQNHFLANEHRLNVALTRARQALYVIGNHSLFKQCRPLYDLRENAKQRKVLLDIPNNPLKIPSFHKLILEVR